MPKKFGLNLQTIRLILGVFSKHSLIKEAIIYGSRAMGNYREGSDIDLTLLAPDMDLGELIKVEIEIDDLMLPYKVDLSLRHSIENPDLLTHIEKFGQTFKE